MWSLSRGSTFPRRSKRQNGVDVRRPSRILLAGVMSLLAVGGGWYWDQTRFPAADSALAGTPITVREQKDAPGVEQFRRGLRIGVAYLRTTGTPLAGPVEARLAHGDPCQPFSSPGEGPTGQADDGWLCVDTLAGGWRGSVPAHPAIAESIAAHELTHVWQAQLGCLPSAGDHQYLWLVEGSATALGFAAVEAAGDIDAVGVDAELRRWRRSARGLSIDLRRYEREGGGDAQYALWAGAVQQLLRPHGPVTLRDFCRAVGRGTPWREAFAEAFDVTVEQFYAAFRSRA